jgi:carbon storage regulator
VLVLTRRLQQSFRIGHDIVITVLEIKGDSVRIGIEAPREVEVHRAEVYEELQRVNRAAASPDQEAVKAFQRLVNETPPEP